MNCPKCNAELEDNDKFCRKCGAKCDKKLFCPECKAELKDGDIFCGNCGTNCASALEMPDKATKTSDEKQAQQAPARAAEPTAAKKVPEDMVLINGGAFLMGCPNDNLFEKKSQHVVSIGSFYVGKYTVTEGEYEELMDKGRKNDRYLPVSNISWYDAIEYCNTRSIKEGLTPAYTVKENRKMDYGNDPMRIVSWNRDADGYRLPTEAEWEYACRAGTITRYNTGDNCEFNYFRGNDIKDVNELKKAFLVAVGKYRPNNWGLYDMHGNVWEWCWDYYADDPDSEQIDPIGPSIGSERIARGGSYKSYPDSCKSYYRKSFTADTKEDDRGFRVVRSFFSDMGHTAHPYFYMGNYYLSLGDFTKALKYHEMAFEIREKVLGRDHADTGSSYLCLGFCYIKLNDIPKAIENYQKSIEIRVKVLGKEHILTAESFYCMGFCYIDLGDFTKAIEYFGKALEIQEKVLGPDHADTASSYFHLGFCYFQLGDIPKSIENFQKSLDIRVKVLGKEHPDTALSYHNTGSCYNIAGDYQKALGYHLEALEIRRKIFGENNNDTAISFSHFAEDYEMLGNKEKAMEFYNKALSIYSSLGNEAGAGDVRQSIQNLTGK